MIFENRIILLLKVQCLQGRNHFVIALLDDRKQACSTRLAPASLKTIINRFLNARCPLGVRVLKDRTKTKNENTLTVSSFSFWWAFRDSNPGPTGYEPVALTN